MPKHRTRTCLSLPLLAALCAAPASAQLPVQPAECEYIESELIELEVEELLELAFEPECAAQRSTALELAETRLAEVERALGDVRAEGIEATDYAEALAELQEQRQGLDLLLIRRALDMGDVGQAQRRVEALLAAPRPAQAEEEDDDEALMGLEEELEAILSILSGHTAAPGFALQIEAPQAEWQLTFGKCGMPMMALHTLAEAFPTRAAAWRAVGQPRAAWDALLESHWVDAAQLGQLPPQIRNYAEAAFGAGAFEAEFERGLQQIWIEAGVEGRYAYMPLFGHRLPLPLGYTGEAVRRPDSSEPERQTVIFENSEQVAAYLRHLLGSEG